MENATPKDIQQLLNRLGELEKKCSRLDTENAQIITDKYQDHLPHYRQS